MTPMTLLLSALRPDAGVMIGVRRVSLIQACLGARRYAVASAVLLAGVNDWLDRQPTRVGTRCDFCGGKITKSSIAALGEYTRFCRGTCLGSFAINDLAYRVEHRLPLFDGMACGCCGGELRSFAPSSTTKLAALTADKIIFICNVCSFRRCPKGERCAARRVA